MPLTRATLLGAACVAGMFAWEGEAKADEAIQLANLRTRRGPLRAWIVEGASLTAHVTPTTPTDSPGGRAWELDVALTGLSGPWKLARAYSATPGVQLDDPHQGRPQGGAHRLKIRVEAPLVCSTEVPREQVVVELDVVARDGRKTETLALDYRCLLGDVVAQPSASAYATLAAEHLRDPLVDRLIRSVADVAPATPAEEVARLQSMIAFSGDMVLPDPPDQGIGGWIHGTGYALTPSETARYGGDCEDWTMLIGAYLERRGVASDVAFTPGHVWLRARGLTGPTDVDFIGTPPSWQPALAPIVEAPMAAVSVLR